MRFQLTRSRGAWRLTLTEPDRQALFQLTRSRGAWRSRLTAIDELKDISTHTLTWSVTGWKIPWYLENWISTHTLTWSVTGRKVSWLYPQQISTHTLTWSVTEYWNLTPNNIEFQLTRSRGAWLDYYTQPIQLYIISTHTLTWSVTKTILQFLDFQSISTHTLTWSVTAIFHIRQESYTFQLTRSRGAWQRGVNCRNTLGHFNSHAHVERDTCIYNVMDKIKISTHTLTWSVTHHLFAFYYITLISTHTLTWSVTLDVVYIWCLLNVMRTYFFI